jgi:transmembrane sensor
MGDERKAGTDLSDEAIAWLVALDCGTADMRAFDAWRDADPRHAAAFAQVAATWRRTADPRLAGLLDQPAKAASPHDETLEVAPPTVSRRAVAGGAIAALVGLSGAGAFLAWPSRSYAATAVGERRTIRLPDGSHAMLNTDTQLAWHFGKQREVWVERGEAALLVRRSDSPLRLHSDPIDARLAGGKFSLRLNPDGGELLVLAGSASAAFAGGSAAIMAGTALTVRDGAARMARLSPQAIATASAWQDGRIVFNGMTLDRAVAEFNRYLPDKMVLQQRDLAAIRLGGEFQIDEPDTFLLGLQESFDVAHRRQGNQILLFRKAP